MLSLQEQAGVRKSSRDASPGLSAAMRLTAVLLIPFCVTACTTQQADPAPAPNIVTGDIQAGIEKHIAEQVRVGGGYFRLPFGDKELQLKLVRVHLEYLATLGPRRHFACVDMASSDGEFYDVDFFMEGVRGAMTVTETTVHKLNGRPFYLWKQKPDKTWGREPVERILRRFDGGVLHIHGNGRHLLEAVSSVKGLKAIFLGDDKGFPPAFDVLDELQARTGDVPLVVQVGFDRFVEELEEQRLPGGVFYKVSGAGDPDTANRLMEKVRVYRT